MKAMILAAGRGERLRPLTDTTPKPLIEVKGKPLIEHHVRRLVAAGHQEIVINLAHLGEKIADYLGDGTAFGANITYSPEPEGGLETGGGILQALPLLGNAPFIVVNGDVFCNYRFDKWQLKPKTLAHLVLIKNPKHNASGDFCLINGFVKQSDVFNPYTYAGIALLSPDLFKDSAPGRFSIAPLLKAATQNNLITGEHHQGIWHDVGTLSRLRSANS